MQDFNRKIENAVIEAKEFIRRAQDVLKPEAGPRETGAMRRQSLELTRALARMRDTNR